MINFAKGARDFFSGCRELTQTPRLWKYAGIPLVINIIAYAAIVGGGVYFFGDLMAMLLPTGDAWYYTLLRAIGWVVFTLTIGFGIYFTFFVVCSIIASPFNDLLAAKYEEMKTGRSVNEGLSIPRVLTQEIKRVTVYVIILILLVIVTALLSVIPVVNFLIPVVWAVFAGFVSAFEFFSYPLDRHGKTNAEKLSYVGRHKMRMLGFGLMTTGAMMIPLVNFIVIPAAVVGATHMYLHRKKKHGGRQSH